MTATSALPFETRAVVRNRRRLFSTAYAARPLLERSLKSLHSELVTRQWFLPETSVTAEVEHYRKRYKDLHMVGPLPHLRNTIKGPHLHETTLSIRASLSFLNSARHGDEYVRPIALYYASAHLLGALSRAFFAWENDRSTHGLSFRAGARNDIAQTTIQIEPTGHFPRLALVCFLLWGEPSCFDPLVSYSAAPTIPISAGDILESFGRNEQPRIVSSLTLEELIGFDFDAQSENMRLRHGFQKYNGVAANAFLRDAIALYLASMLARYRIRQWQAILDGQSNDYRLFFEAVFDRFVEFTIDRVLLVLEKPTKTFADGTGYLHPSPFASWVIKPN